MTAVHTLLSGSAREVGSDQLRARWETLPSPAQRYLRYAIRENAAAVKSARLRHGGVFRAKPGQRWWRIHGEQYFLTATPGFVWNARVWPVPLVWIDARDSLIAGRGRMLVRLLSSVSIADASGAEIDQAASLRWLAECAWFPYAFAGDAVEWEPIDARSARVSLRSEGLPVSAIVDIDEEGKLVGLRAKRYADFGNGKPVLTDWLGHYREYREFGGFRVPSSVEVEWALASGPFRYVRFHVTQVEYNVTEGR